MGGESRSYDDGCMLRTIHKSARIMQQRVLAVSRSVGVLVVGEMTQVGEAV